MPLTMANPGECYTIRKVGGKEETRRFQGSRWKRYGSQNPDLIGKKERR